jgi:hypothetical protein
MNFFSSFRKRLKRGLQLFFAYSLAFSMFENNR